MIFFSSYCYPLKWDRVMKLCFANFLICLIKKIKRTVFPAFKRDAFASQWMVARFEY